MTKVNMLSEQYDKFRNHKDKVSELTQVKVIGGIFMKKIKRLICAMMCVFSMVMCCSFIPAKAASYDSITISGKYLQQEAKKHLDLLNNKRKQLGLNPLQMDADLMKAAETRASEIVVYFSHNRPTQNYFNTIHSKAWGENIHMGPSTASQALNALWNSPPHKENMLRGSWTNVGIGAFKTDDGRVHWVQLFSNTWLNPQKTYKKEVNKTLTIKALSDRMSYKVETNAWYDTLSGGEKNRCFLTGTYRNEKKDNEISFPIYTNIKWKSSKSSVAKVTSKGDLYGLKNGKVTIYATYNGKEAKKTLVVDSPNHVTFKTNGGTLHELQARDFDYMLNLRKPTRKGYLFKGWYVDEGLKEEVSTYIFNDLTVYAKWWKVKVTDVPKKPSLSITKESRRLQAKCSTVNKADGYQFYYSTAKSFNAKTTKKVIVDKNSFTSLKLEKGKTVYVKVRAYRLDSCNNKIYGEFSEVAKIKVN